MKLHLRMHWKCRAINELYLRIYTKWIKLRLCNPGLDEAEGDSSCQQIIIRSLHLQDVMEKKTAIVRRSNGNDPAKPASIQIIRRRNAWCKGVIAGCPHLTKHSAKN